MAKPAAKKSAIAKPAAKEKKPASGYMLFCKETRPKIVAEKPELTFGEVGKELGAAWKALTPEEKAKY